MSEQVRVEERSHLREISDKYFDGDIGFVKRVVTGDWYDFDEYEWVLGAISNYIEKRVEEETGERIRVEMYPESYTDLKYTIVRPIVRKVIGGKEREVILFTDYTFKYGKIIDVEETGDLEKEFNNMIEEYIERIKNELKEINRDLAR